MTLNKHVFSNQNQTLERERERESQISVVLHPPDHHPPLLQPNPFHTNMKTTLMMYGSSRHT